VYRVNLFKQIHDIVFNGKGGYDWYTVYEMPIWLRNLTHKLIADDYAKENQRYQELYSKGNKGKKMANSTSTTNIDIANPNQAVISALKNNQRI
jgi:hypothetical protein